MEHHTHTPPATLHLPPPIQFPRIKFSPENERNLLKIFTLGYLHQLLRDLFQEALVYEQVDLTECYSMDSKMIQLLIKGIIETEEYTLEGISYYTRIPFDVIYDAARGVSTELTITPWVKIVELYLRVKPDVSQAFATRLLALSHQNASGVVSILSE